MFCMMKYIFFAFLKREEHRSEKDKYPLLNSNDECRIFTLHCIEVESKLICLYIVYRAGGLNYQIKNCLFLEKGPCPTIIQNSGTPRS